jgi:hypothetical protein
MSDLYLLSLRIEATLDPHAILKAAEVEELLDDIKAVIASCSQRPQAEAKALRHWLSEAKDKSNWTVLQRVEARSRDCERAEQEARDRDAYYERLAQRERERRARGPDRGTPGYAKGA